MTVFRIVTVSCQNAVVEVELEMGYLPQYVLVVFLDALI